MVNEDQQDKAQARMGAPNERESCFWLRPRTPEVIGSGDSINSAQHKPNSVLNAMVRKGYSQSECNEMRAIAIPAATPTHLSNESPLDNDRTHARPHQTKKAISSTGPSRPVSSVSSSQSV